MCRVQSSGRACSSRSISEQRVERLTSGGKQMQKCWHGEGQPWRVWLPRVLLERKGPHRRLVPGPWWHRWGRDAILWLLSNTAPEQFCKHSPKKKNYCFWTATCAHLRINFNCHFFWWASSEWRVWSRGFNLKWWPGSLALLLIMSIFCVWVFKMLQGDT